MIKGWRALAARAYFALCLASGQMLRSARYSTVRIVHEDGQRPGPPAAGLGATGARRADDLRALLVTCLVRTAPEKRVETLELILDVYADEDVARVLATSFRSVWQRSLTLHLLQARLSFQCFSELGELL